MTDFATTRSTVGDVPVESAPSGPIDVACTHGDSEALDCLASGLDRYDCLAVRRTADPTTDLGALSSADCLVTDGESGPELLAEIRDREEAVPMVLYTEAPVEPLLQGTAETALVDVVRPDGGDDAVALLANRVKTLADHRRVTDLATRAAIAAEAASDGIAVVDPGGTVTFANGQFARQFGYDRGDVAGRDWRELFDDETVERLEVDALSAVDDGWQWIGTVDGRRADGGSVTLRTRVTDGVDGSVVFAAFQQPDDTRG